MGCLSQTANENRFVRFLNNRQNFRKFCPTRPERAEAPEATRPERAEAPEATRPERAEAPEATRPERAEAPEATRPGLGASALSGRVGHAGHVELTCENSITEISHRFRLISEKKKKN